MVENDLNRNSVSVGCIHFLLYLTTLRQMNRLYSVEIEIAG
jgi:hypothetical protein